LQEIIEFSELEEFIDNPVRTYSSGMYMRLAFSVAINVDANILLIDEILAVGDANFQKKCFDKLREIKAHGTTIVIVSHALDQIEQICETSYWIEDGLIKDSGIPKTVHDHYLQSMEQKRNQQLEKQHHQETQKPPAPEALPAFCEKSAVRMGTGAVRFTNAMLCNLENQKQFIFDTEEKIKIILEYTSSEPDLKGNFGYGIFREDGLHCYGTNILIETGECIPIQPHGKLEIIVQNSLLPAKYFLDIAVHSHDGIILDDIRKVLSFAVSSSHYDIGVCRLKSEFSWR
ncbi:MAG: ABC transporter ATP-binding protein, partial [Oscillospiraceae bacterium]|nr:ABC transporter ATP-binding protein [Oscillospiraceae bacterium]